MSRAELSKALLFLLVLALSSCTCTCSSMSMAVQRQLQLGSTACELDTDSLYDDNIVLDEADKEMGKEESLNIQNYGQLLTISYPIPTVDALKDACSGVGGIIIGSDAETFQCTSHVEGTAVTINFVNVFECLAQSCDGQYTSDDLLQELAFKHGMDCQLGLPETVSPAPSPVLQSTWDQCDLDEEPFLDANLDLANALTDLVDNMDIDVKLGGMTLSYPQANIDLIRPLCEAAQGVFQGVQEEVFDCVKDEIPMVVTISNVYDCYPPGCEGYPADQKMIGIWDAMGLECTIESKTDGHDNDTPGDDGGNPPVSQVPSVAPTIYTEQTELPTIISDNAENPLPDDASGAPSSTPTPATDPVDSGMGESSGPTASPTTELDDNTGDGLQNQSRNPSPAPSAVMISTASPTPAPTPTTDSHVSDAPSFSLEVIRPPQRPPTESDNSPLKNEDNDSKSSSNSAFDVSAIPQNTLYGIVAGGVLVVLISCFVLRRRQRRNRTELLYQMSELRLSDPDDEEASQPIV